MVRVDSPWFPLGLQSIGPCQSEHFKLENILSGIMKVILFVTAIWTMLIVYVSARAVNISNSWMLPEESFPVFYRYFRDRISWNEADAVCQFHHGNLVTVDTTFQYDAVRAYLKEMDITNNVWIGLSRTDQPKFTWRNFHDLTAQNYWQEAIPDGDEPLCAAMDPAADFRWHALTCGGPDVASFICELIVPAWATGPNGCLISELPSLVALYIPEHSSIELTSDCGLGGTKRIMCKGKRNREEIVRRLSCNEEASLENKTPQLKFQQQVTTVPSSTGFLSSSVAINIPNDEQANPAIKTTNPWIWTSNTVDSESFNQPTRQRRETEDTLVPEFVKVTTETSTSMNILHNQYTTAIFKSIKEQEIASSVLPEDLNTSSQVIDTLNPEEFNDAINQDQLLSIIMNGKMFDIINLNDTEENTTFTSEWITTTVSNSERNMTIPSKEEYSDLKLAESSKLNRTFRKSVSYKFRSEMSGIKDVHPIDIQNNNASIASLNNLEKNEIKLNKSSTIKPNSKLESNEKQLQIDKYSPNVEYDTEPTIKPNRQRQLTRPNRRSFYPYFFSRVLG